MKERIVQPKSFQIMIDGIQNNFITPDSASFQALSNSFLWFFPWYSPELVLELSKHLGKDTVTAINVIQVRVRLVMGRMSKNMGVQ